MVRFLLVLAPLAAAGCLEPNPNFEPPTGPPRLAQLFDAGLVGQLDGTIGVLPDGHLEADARSSGVNVASGELCAHCLPDAPNCLDGLCVVNSEGEAFCTRTCSDAVPCPDGYRCMKVKAEGVRDMPRQCIPESFSCR